MAKEIKSKGPEPGAFYDDLKTRVASMEEDFLKFSNGGNKAAGRRLRKELQEMKKMIKPWRDGIQDRILTL